MEIALKVRSNKNVFNQTKTEKNFCQHTDAKHAEENSWLPTEAWRCYKEQRASKDIRCSICNYKNKKENQNLKIKQICNCSFFFFFFFLRIFLFID